MKMSKKFHSYVKIQYIIYYNTNFKKINLIRQIFIKVYISVIFTYLHKKIYIKFVEIPNKKCYNDFIEDEISDINL